VEEGEEKNSSSTEESRSPLAKTSELSLSSELSTVSFFPREKVP
jgi:hypothetical protein